MTEKAKRFNGAERSRALDLIKHLYESECTVAGFMEPLEDDSPHKTIRVPWNFDTFNLLTYGTLKTKEDGVHCDYFDPRLIAGEVVKAIEWLNNQHEEAGRRAGVLYKRGILRYLDSEIAAMYATNGNIVLREIVQLLINEGLSALVTGHGSVACGLCDGGDIDGYIMLSSREANARTRITNALRENLEKLTTLALQNKFSDIHIRVVSSL